MRVVLDTSVLIAGDDTSEFDDVVVSSVCFAELAFGIGIASDPVERISRERRLQRLMSEFGPGLPFDDDAAKAYGVLTSLVRTSGRNPRSRALDLMIAATAYTHEAGVLTRNPDDFAGLERLVAIRTPAA